MCLCQDHAALIEIETQAIDLESLLVKTHLVRARKQVEEVSALRDRKGSGNQITVSVREALDKIDHQQVLARGGVVRFELRKKGYRRLSCLGLE